MDSAELHHAFVWDCNSCGRENLERIIWDERTPEEIEEELSFDESDMAGYDALDEEGFDLDDRSVIFLPDVVFCKFCEEPHACSLVDVAEDDEGDEEL